MASSWRSPPDSVRGLAAEQWLDAGRRRRPRGSGRGSPRGTPEVLGSEGQLGLDRRADDLLAGSWRTVPTTARCRAA